MPDPDQVTPSRKRKRGQAKAQGSDLKAHKVQTNNVDNDHSQILLLEQQVRESRKHYNNIVTLIRTFREDESGKRVIAAISLCRVFCRLMAAGSMSRANGAPDGELIIVQWLRDRYREYSNLLLGMLRRGDRSRQLTALTLLMRMVKDDGTHVRSRSEYTFPQEPLADIIQALLEADHGAHVREEFMDKYANKYDDVRYYMFRILAQAAAVDGSLEASELSSNIFSLLSRVETIQQPEDSLTRFYVQGTSRKKHPVRGLATRKARAQEAWLAFLRRDLAIEQRKAVLAIMTSRVVPWFTKAEALMDFLTDSYDVGGSMSLLALSGLFDLIQKKNLDYPLFYQKLYSLLDVNVLHSRHRSRFFRLLDTFLASSHLPAALVASFIKRLSRLALYAPPAGIVIVVPWVYNLLGRHPTCTFMIHRELGSETRAQVEDEGMDDPFDERQKDPMKTRALDSSLWEIRMLQSHYHPNVATLAKIISEPFHKQAYNLEDFLDHSYGSLLEAELSKEIKKLPVVEFQIPKRIFTVVEGEIEGENEDGTVLRKLWDGSGS